MWPSFIYFPLYRLIYPTNMKLKRGLLETLLFLVSIFSHLRLETKRGDLTYLVPFFLLDIKKSTMVAFG